MRAVFAAVSLALLPLLASCGEKEVVACCAIPEPPEPPPVAIAVNSAGAFATLFDETASLPEAERVAAFRNDLVQRFPAFYGPQRYDTPEAQAQLDQRIARAIAGFPAIREAYLAKAEGFEAQLAANIKTFRAAFPDFAATTPIALVHSLGEMDGGTRGLDGQTWLVFGVDGMVAYHPYANEAAFFHHELFHTYHQTVSPPGDCADVACALWTEGLAVYVARQMNPGASDAELLLTLPKNLVPDTRANLPAAFAQLGSVLSSTDSAAQSALFSFGNDGSGLPMRRGYYLGLLVAEELAKTHSLDQLVRLPMDEVRPLIASAVERLAAAP
jgi:hypothetical protein